MEAVFMLVKADTDKEIYGRTLDEYIRFLKEDGVKILKMERTDIRSDKQRVIEVLGLQYAVWQRDGYLYWRINNIRGWDEFLAKTRSGYQGYQYRKLQKVEGWQTITLTDISDGKEKYKLVVGVRYE